MSFDRTAMLDVFLSDSEDNNFEGQDIIHQPKKKVKKPIGFSERYQRWLQYKFFCAICKTECIEARIFHHSKMHMENGVYTCPVCVRKFKSKDVFAKHVMEHVKMPRGRKKRTKKLLLKKERLAKSSLARIASVAVREQPRVNTQDYVTFSKLENCHLQDRDLYPCPGTDCSKVYKQFKYLSVHLKVEHENDENAMHYMAMKNRRERCLYCRRHFVSAFHLQEHEQVHRGPQPYLCVSVGCYARFDSVNELLRHKQQHNDLRYKCELSGCNIVFSDLGLLYHHEAQHFRDASYACNFSGCKKFYYFETEFTDHISRHFTNGQIKKVRIKQEENVSGENLPCLSDSELFEHKDASCVRDSLISLPSGFTSSEEIQIKLETKNSVELLQV